MQLRQIFVGYLNVRVGVFDAGAFRIQKVDKGIQPDVELLDKFVESDFCHLISS